MQNVESLTPLMLARFTQIDYDTEIALITVINDGKDNAMAIGKDKGGDIMMGEVLKNNRKMLNMFKDIGFRLSHDDAEDEFVEVRRQLQETINNIDQE